MTLKLWKKTKKPNAKLIFISFESAPLSKIELKQVYKHVKGLKSLSSQLIKKLPTIYQSTHRIFFESDNVELILIYDDFKSLINFKFSVDAWFLDGFSPTKNPELWEANLMAEVATHTKTGGSCATYTAAGFVRRGLQAGGFEVIRCPGFGRKRHMTRGIKS